ncbi:PepSY-associated TM helix domain-containing protein [Lysobacter sp. CA199]|uniref:PepSY-associated TM helix domain-containing protein n=1 Tax=Lysobacter sp. CA199 TaxID=3455608 RepID=UPI003F8D7017
MKAATLRIFLSVHTWVGLASGMLLFIAFYAGAITVFVHELQGWERPAQATLSGPEAMAASQALVDRVLREQPQAAHGLTLSLPGDHGPRPSAYWYDGATGVQHKFVLEEGGDLHRSPGRGGFVEFIYDLHFTAGLPRTVGSYLFGVVCILYGLALVSGVVIYAPVFLKDLFALRMGRNIKRFWQDAHNVVGMLSLPFHIIFAWSGAVLTIGFLMLAPFQFLVFENKLMTVLERDFEIAPHVEPAGIVRPTLPVAELVRRAERALPGMHAESLFYHDVGDANGRVTAYGAIAQRRLNGFGGVVLNAATGEVVNALGPKDFQPGMAMLRGLQTLHYGNFGGFAMKWLYFLLGLAGAFLFYSGNLLWIEARRKRRQVAQPRRTRLVAALSIGVCLGCVAGVSAVFLAAALLPQAWIARSYFLVFFAAIAWAFVRSPARAAHELLWLCALLTAAIPLAGWIGSGEHVFGALLHGRWNRVLVDTTALAMAIAFWRMAVTTLSRGRTGDPNSVWALR